MRKLYLLFLVLAGCHYSSDSSEPLLTSIQIQDRNGLTETISIPERLAVYNQVDFLNSQPYKKVLRVFKREGKNSAKITTYHPNGFPWQYLEVQDMRAFGAYREWYPNGQLKVEATVIGGTADVVPGAQQDWLFDGLSRAWDEKGRLLAEIPYQKGVIEGKAFHYAANGQIEKELLYHENELDGESVEFFPDGSKKNRTLYQKGLLIEGEYFSPKGDPVSQIKQGAGLQPIYKGNTLERMVEFYNGYPEGMIKIFGPSGEVTALYTIKNGKKQGEEIRYFPNSTPKLSIPWEDDAISGLVKTWYPTGGLQSQREFARNKKMGAALGWYRDGSLMYLEEYEEDRLIKGQYFKKNQKEPASTVSSGNGYATLFDEEGIFLRKVQYVKGKPLDPEN
ncbi:MAG: hypothetical protein KGJ02_01395 [Verrucomicrobiota bacterium]|nr:hypothetical protein [Verrucomicrobiota bacterium]